MAISSSLGSSALLPAGLGFRNVLINGDFKVWQRGTSFTWSSGQPYTADRWCITPGGTAAFSASRQTASLDGFQYCFRLQRTAANTNTSALYVSQPIETITSIPLANKQITFSFNARAGANFSAASSILNVRIITGTGTDGNFLAATLTGQATLLDTTATLTTSWQKFTYSVLVPSGVNQIQPVLLYTPTGTAGADDYFEITGVQLEQNYQPTPFEQRPYGVELALCQRYYETSYNGVAKGTNTAVGVVYASSSTDQYSSFVLPLPLWFIQKRASPTVTVYSQTGTINTWTYSRSGVGDTAATVQISGGYSSPRSQLLFLNAGATYVSATGYGHFVADAEL